MKPVERAIEWILISSRWVLAPFMAGALIASIPVAIAYNLFLDRFIAGITGGAVK